jgi:hypothetical protein
MNRALTEQEKGWLLRGLNTLGTGEYFGGGNWIDMETNERLPLSEPVNPQHLIEQIDNLSVVGECGCGEPNCHTVQFQNYERGKSEAIVCYHTEDKRMLIIHVHADSGLLAELEIV